MGKFDNWFNKKLTVSRYPLPNEVIGYDYVINVSDEYIESVALQCIKNNIQYFWFPLTECNHNMGLNSIYGALQILYIAEYRNKKVLLHCHAGSNRSVTVAQSFYYMKTGNQIIEPENKNMLNDEDIFKMFNITEEKDKQSYIKIRKRNRVENNINSGHLPGIYNYEKFLNMCNETFKKYTIASGGKLDNIKSITKTSNY